MDKFADLHIHTNYSDSTDSPSDVVRKALDAELSCIAITDHDTLDGVLPTQKEAESSGLEVITGVELSTEHMGKDIHILGYFLDSENGPLQKTLKKAQSSRIERLQEMIDKLVELGCEPIDADDVCSRTQSDAVGRPHLAAVMVEKGIVSSIQEAFNKYLAEGQPAYIPKFKVSPFDAVELIRESGGVAVMAHPLVTSRDELIPKLVDSGLQGIEVYYPTHSSAAVDYYLKIADKHGLIATGGSDAHGDAKRHTYIGRIKVAYDIVEKLRVLSHV